MNGKPNKIKLYTWFAVAVIMLTAALGNRFLGPSRGAAQNVARPLAVKSYDYGKIFATIGINKDSTMDVAEAQTFNFIGNFHVGTRDIPLSGMSGITDVVVKDGASFEPLAYSFRRLNPQDPASAGKYAVWSDLNATHIEWYFNLADTTHAWVIYYKVHGAISFQKAYDRLYWNIFSGYSVPIGEADAQVVLPAKVDQSNVQFTAYRTNMAPIDAAYTASDTFTFRTSNVAPREAFTIDVTWPKGIVDQRSFLLDFLRIHWFGSLAFLIVALSVLIAGGWWILEIKVKERPGTIIPQYEPPGGLRPAVAEFIVKEATVMGFVATLVDLAVRGYVRIEELAPSRAQRLVAYGAVAASTIPVLIVMGIIFVVMAHTQAVLVFLLVLFASIFVGFGFQALALFKKREYRVTSVKSVAGDPNVKEYEKKYLNLLFSVGDGNSFTTKDLRTLKASELYKGIEEVRDLIKQETNEETRAFAERPKVSRKLMKLIGIVVVFLIVPFALGVDIAGLFPYLIPIGAVVWAYFFIKYAMRRSPEGIKLRDEWLGFKMFLEVADRYRMENLTPDAFEKYLPYAMVFGIEKKWASVFDRANIAVAAPVWYAGGTGFAGGGPGGSGFSPGAFSASLSSSFMGAFGGSAGGGAGGGGFGGGGAGGGGGGGGGGAA